MPNDDWKTLRVPPDAYDAAKVQKEDAGRTWGEQVVRPEGDENPGTEYYTPDEIAEYVAGQVDFPTADVKEAVRDVLKEELPEEVVGR